MPEQAYKLRWDDTLGWLAVFADGSVQPLADVDFAMAFLLRGFTGETLTEEKLAELVSLADSLQQGAAGDGAGFVRPEGAPSWWNQTLEQGFKPWADMGQDPITGQKSSTQLATDLRNAETFAKAFGIDTSEAQAGEAQAGVFASQADADARIAALDVGGQFESAFSPQDDAFVIKERKAEPQPTFNDQMNTLYDEWVKAATPEAQQEVEGRLFALDAVRDRVEQQRGMSLSEAVGWALQVAKTPEEAQRYLHVLTDPFGTGQGELGPFSVTAAQRGEITPQESAALGPFAPETTQQPQPAAGAVPSTTAVFPGVRQGTTSFAESDLLAAGGRMIGDMIIKDGFVYNRVANTERYTRGGQIVGGAGPFTVPPPGALKPEPKGQDIPGVGGAIGEEAFSTRTAPGPFALQQPTGQPTFGMTTKQERQSTSAALNPTFSVTQAGTLNANVPKVTQTFTPLFNETFREIAERIFGQRKQRRFEERGLLTARMR